MELGALVCTVGDPRCGECPLASVCLARRECCTREMPFDTSRGGSGGGTGAACDVCDGSRAEAGVVATTPAKYPLKALKRAVAPAAWSVAVALQRAAAGGGGGGVEVLLEKRPPSGLLAGQLDLPSARVGEHDDAAARRRALDVYLSSAYGLELPPRGRTREITPPLLHVFSSLRLSVALVACDIERDFADAAIARSGGRLQWANSESVSRQGATALLAKMLAAACPTAAAAAAESDASDDAARA